MTFVKTQSLNWVNITSAREITVCSGCITIWFKDDDCVWASFENTETARKWLDQQMRHVIQGHFSSISDPPK